MPLRCLSGEVRMADACRDRAQMLVSFGSSQTLGDSDLVLSGTES